MGACAAKPRYGCMSTPPNTVNARRLGAYLDCTPDAIESALGHSARDGAQSARLGDVLIAAELISRDDLLASIRAQRVDRLRGCSLFAELSRPLLELLADGFEEVSVDMGEQFITQDESEPYLYVLATGLVEVFVLSPGGGEAHIATLHEGEPISCFRKISTGCAALSVRSNI
jgi:hypothetical protein